MKKNLYCPRCGTTDISVYKDTFECTICKDDNNIPLEFKKVFLGILSDSEILTIGEMESFFEIFEELRDPKKVKEIFKSLRDNDLEN
jgi:hypothetical protein